MTPEERARRAIREGEQIYGFPFEAVAKEIREAIAEERERCAKLVEKLADPIVLLKVMPSFQGPMSGAAMLAVIAESIRKGP